MDELPGWLTKEEVAMLLFAIDMTSDNSQWTDEEWNKLESKLKKMRDTG